MVSVLLFLSVVGYIDSDRTGEISGLRKMRLQIRGKFYYNVSFCSLYQIMQRSLQVRILSGQMTSLARSVTLRTRENLIWNRISVDGNRLCAVLLQSLLSVILAK